eukprot:PLAT5643.1.p2 GENE.PLAT5643.1~~PLAT5643.1.p2  ORF type:complete len:361 (+),score=119.69 PLAT5643.1:41-1084(+)
MKVASLLLAVALCAAAGASALPMMGPFGLHTAYYGQGLAYGASPHALPAALLHAGPYAFGAGASPFLGGHSLSAFGPFAFGAGLLPMHTGMAVPGAMPTAAWGVHPMVHAGQVNWPAFHSAQASGKMHGGLAGQLGGSLVPGLYGAGAMNPYAGLVQAGGPHAGTKPYTPRESMGSIPNTANIFHGGHAADRVAPYGGQLTETSDLDGIRVKVKDLTADGKTEDASASDAGMTAEEHEEEEAIDAHEGADVDATDEEAAADASAAAESADEAPEALDAADIPSGDDEVVEGDTPLPEGDEPLSAEEQDAEQSAGVDALKNDDEAAEEDVDPSEVEIDITADGSEDEE